MGTKEEQSTGKVGGREEMIVEQLKLMVEEGRSLSQGKYGSNVCATGIAKFDANTTARQRKEAVLRAVTNGWTQERRVKDAPRVVFNSSECVTEVDKDGNEVGEKDGVCRVCFTVDLEMSDILASWNATCRQGSMPQAKGRV